MNLHVIIFIRKRRYEFITPLGLAPLSDVAPPYFATGTIALNGCLAKVCQFHVQVRVCVCVRVCAPICVHVSVHVHVHVRVHVPVRA
jgi:hypothetical protein